MSAGAGGAARLLILHLLSQPLVQSRVHTAAAFTSPKHTCYVPPCRLAGRGRSGSRLRAVAAERAVQRTQCGGAPGGAAGGEATAGCDAGGRGALECLAAHWPPGTTQPSAVAAGGHSAGDAGRGAAAAWWVPPARCPADSLLRAESGERGCTSAPAALCAQQKLHNAMIHHCR